MTQEQLQVHWTEEALMNHIIELRQHYLWSQGRFGGVSATFTHTHLHAILFYCYAYLVSESPDVANIIFKQKPVWALTGFLFPKTMELVGLPTESHVERPDIMVEQYEIQKESLMKADRNLPELNTLLVKLKDWIEVEVSIFDQEIYNTTVWRQGYQSYLSNEILFKEVKENQIKSFALAYPKMFELKSPRKIQNENEDKDKDIAPTITIEDEPALTLQEYYQRKKEIMIKRSAQRRAQLEKNQLEVCRLRGMQSIYTDKSNYIDESNYTDKSNYIDESNYTDDCIAYVVTYALKQNVDFPAMYLHNLLFVLNALFLEKTGEVLLPKLFKKSKLGARNRDIEQSFLINFGSIKIRDIPKWKQDNYGNHVSRFIYRLTFTENITLDNFDNWLDKLLKLDFEDLYGIIFLLPSYEKDSERLFESFLPFENEEILEDISTLKRLLKTKLKEKKNDDTQTIRIM